MKRTLPPLLATRAFESAARNLSFQVAADELHVTASAISHQIRSLEEYLGLALFCRDHRGVSLTPEGTRYLMSLGKALDEIASATADIRERKLSGQLRVGATSAFISRWIFPRLKRFTSSYPLIDLDLQALVGPVDFGAQRLDLAICMGPQERDGFRCWRIMSSPLFVVCNPGLRKVLKQPSDLKGQVLLHFDNGEEWSRWLEAARVEGIDVSSGPRFNDCNLLLQAAVEGQGVALTFTALADRELSSAQLIKPFELQLLPDAWYYIVCPGGAASRPKIAAFRDWILSEAQSAGQQIPARSAAE